MVRLASAMISYERLFSRLEGISQCAGRTWCKDNCPPTLPDGTNLYPMSLVVDYSHCLRHLPNRPNGLCSS
jgi:hypothetical protein